MTQSPEPESLVDGWLDEAKAILGSRGIALDANLVSSLEATAAALRTLVGCVDTHLLQPDQNT